MIALAALAGLVGAAASIEVYAYFSGEHPIGDLIYDVRLRRASLEALDRACAANPRRSALVVSLTTLPSRLDRLDLTLKSLMNQHVRPAAIRLYVPERSRREQRAYVVPDRFRRLQSLEIVTTDDYGPATKFIPALLAHPADQLILVVDDDRVYHPYLVQQMDAAAARYPDAAIAGSGWDAPADLVDRPTTLAATLGGRPPAPLKATRVHGVREVDMVQGFAGYVVRPRFFDLASLVDYTRAPDAAFYVDDVWISAHCRVRRLVVGGRRTNFQSRFDAAFYKASSLGIVNRGRGGYETRNNTIMLKFFADRWKHGTGS